MSWMYLLIAGVLECMWAIGLKQSNGFTKFWPSVISVVLIIVSLFLLSLAMRTIPVGMAYAVWTGIGATSLVVIGMLFMGEPAGIARIACLLMIVGGIVGLQLIGET
ncbi:multidrug efflux SMR transporter [Marinomonas sp. A79]|uniref:Guanidinium exporter n=1 Tax=Marinomonas vulgaris TaxID=2823372 RepID=A0ABS5HA32_9GAMM|nr:multidrug efflux SMR transporter [Marinomonas vulgaris]MBR7888229.1 multidrug efflux SMR transporter [Marinomonas vulgaris]